MYHSPEAPPERSAFQLKPDALGCTPGSHYAAHDPSRVHDLTDAFNSPNMRATRLSMLQGHAVAACQYCYDREDAGGRSYRQQMDADFGHCAEVRERIESTSEDGFVASFPFYLDLRLGNLCNLRCVMCGYPVSSSWAAVGAIRTPALIEPYADGQLLATLRARAAEIRRIYFAGGEPLLQPLHMAVLDMLIDQQVAQNIELRYTTNLTRIPAGLFDRLQRFKDVELGASCDGTRAVFERIRRGASWPAFLANLIEARRFVRVSIQASPQRDNIAELGELVWWAVEQQLSINITNVVQHPPQLSIRNLDVREKRMHAGALAVLATQLSAAGHTNLASQVTMVTSFMNSAPSGTSGVPAPPAT